MDETWEDVLKDLLEDSNAKKKFPYLRTYPPADSVGRQCQTNNILRVVLVIVITYMYYATYNETCSLEILPFFNQTVLRGHPFWQLVLRDHLF